jgi:capsular exopolysaccharide synthesis family protein
VLRTNILFSSADGGGRAYLVTSAGPGDGKTTTAANLAVALSQNDARVLVVDADLRRPVLHTHFELERAPGLSDLIVGSCSVAEAIHPTKARGLSVIPSGYLPPNPAELLGSANMKDLTAVLRKRFDWVLFDAPPVLAMADALVLSSLTDGTILVVRADATPLPSVQQAIDHLSGVGGKLTGVVLNGVNFERHSYYYGPYYGDYTRKYASRSEERPPDARVVGGR